MRDSKSICKEIKCWFSLQGGLYSHRFVHEEVTYETKQSLKLNNARNLSYSLKVL